MKAIDTKLGDIIRCTFINTGDVWVVPVIGKGHKNNNGYDTRVGFAANQSRFKVATPIDEVEAGWRKNLPDLSAYEWAGSIRNGVDCEVIGSILPPEASSLKMGATKLGDRVRFTIERETVEATVIGKQLNPFKSFDNTNGDYNTQVGFKEGDKILTMANAIDDPQVSVFDYNLHDKSPYKWVRCIGDWIDCELLTPAPVEQPEPILVEQPEPIPVEQTKQIKETNDLGTALLMAGGAVIGGFIASLGAAQTPTRVATPASIETTDYEQEQAEAQV
jgi:hypothetical protein